MGSSPTASALVCSCDGGHTRAEEEKMRTMEDTEMHGSEGKFLRPFSMESPRTRIDVARRFGGVVGRWVAEGRPRQPRGFRVWWRSARRQGELAPDTRYGHRQPPYCGCSCCRHRQRRYRFASGPARRIGGRHNKVKMIRHLFPIALQKPASPPPSLVPGITADHETPRKRRHQPHILPLRRVLVMPA